MKRKTIKRILIAAGGLFLLLVAVLAVHIYIALRPMPITPNLREMARIDIYRPVTGADSAKIASWMYGEKGVNQVLVSARTRKVIFTYYPFRNSAQQITKDFQAALALPSAQIMPTEDQLTSGCPVAAVSFGLKVSKFFHHLF